MADLVTIEQARAHIRIDTDADDLWLETMIPAVSDAALSWLKDNWRAYEWETDADGEVVRDISGNPVIALGVDGNPIVRPRVRAAVLVELAQQYRFRDGSDAAVAPVHFGHGYVLGTGATSLLFSCRKSTVA